MGHHQSSQAQGAAAGASQQTVPAARSAIVGPRLAMCFVMSTPAGCMCVMKHAGEAANNRRVADNNSCQIMARMLVVASYSWLHCTAAHCTAHHRAKRLDRLVWVSLRAWLLPPAVHDISHMRVLCMRVPCNAMHCHPTACMHCTPDCVPTAAGAAAGVAGPGWSVAAGCHCVPAVRRSLSPHLGCWCAPSVA